MRSNEREQTAQRFCSLIFLCRYVFKLICTGKWSEAYISSKESISSSLVCMLSIPRTTENSSISFSVAALK